MEKIREGERKDRSEGEAKRWRVTELSGNVLFLDIWRRPQWLERLASCVPQGGAMLLPHCSVLP